MIAYVGSASYRRADDPLQPQFDVLGDGWRQPGSAFKPFVYCRHRRQDPDRGDDVHGRDHQLRAVRCQALHPDPGGRVGAVGASATPSSSRSTSPPRRPGLLNGLEHQFARTKDFGLRYQKSAVPVVSESIGTLVVHPIDMVSAFGMIGNGGSMPRHTILKVLDATGNQVWPQPDATLAGERVASREAAFVITDILAGNTIKSVNPFWAKWQVTDGVGASTIRPAAYKTGTTSNNVDVHAYGYLAPPKDSTLPALVAGVWLGNSDNTPNDGKLSLDTSAPLWSAILSDVSKGMPIEGFARVKPKGLVTAKVDAFTGMLPGAATVKTVTEIFLPGTVPTQSSKIGVAVDIDQSSGLLWKGDVSGRW